MNSAKNTDYAFKIKHEGKQEPQRVFCPWGKGRAKGDPPSKSISPWATSQGRASASARASYLGSTLVMTQLAHESLGVYKSCRGKANATGLRVEKGLTYSKIKAALSNALIVNFPIISILALKKFRAHLGTKNGTTQSIYNKSMVSPQRCHRGAAGCPQ